MTIMRTRRAIGLAGMGALTAASLGLPRAARAALTQQVTMIVPYAPGTTDQEMRALAPILSRLLGQTVVVENRVGAGGAVGSRAVAQARPDGHTMLYAAAAVLNVQPMMPHSAYGPDALVPVARVSANTQVIACRAEAPWQTLRELLDFARANPGRLNFASAGVGSAVHMAGEAVAMAAGVRITHVPFQGAAPATTSVVAGTTDFTLGLPVAIMPQVSGGRLRALAQVGPERSPVVPEVPTLRELGVDLALGSDIGLFAPRGTPDAILDLWTEAARAAVESAEFREFAVRARVNAAFLNRAAFTAEVMRDRAVYERLIPTLNLT
jgi:tripartite-type tricarboxylate transporter receptor subunit TctC